MHKVLLVDDEIFVRRGLQNLIDWEGLGFTVIGEAENGEEALERIKALAPDLVITDIRMPLLDGLQLIRAAREQTDVDPSFIIISGYNDFDYAKQAIQFGIFEYILKPIDDQELKTALRKLSGTLSRKKLTRNSSEQQMTCSIMEALVQGELGEQHAATISSALQLDEEGYFCYVVIEAYNDAISFRDIAAAIKQINKQESRVTEADALGCRLNNTPIYEQQDGRCGVLLAFESDHDYDYKHLLEVKLSHLSSRLSQALAAPVSLFAGRLAERITSVKQSYESANETVQHKYAEGGPLILHFEQIEGKALHTLAMDEQLINQFMEQLEENDKHSYQQSVQTMFDMFRQKRYEPSAIWSAINRCVIAIIRVIQEMDGHIQQLHTFTMMKDWEHRSMGPQELQQLFGEFAEEAADYISQLRKEQAKGGIEKIRKYIEAHYEENISLRSIAAHFYMNPVYLGQLFRKSYNIYFNDFLLDLRLQEAKKLLRTTDMRMYEIADKVGFQNADYFVAQFVKQERITPKEYRNRLIERKL